MDLKLKGKTWVGNIYQKFEAMCQEVDEFVSKDTVKYVENQVQTVGESVKSFCSDVVQDLLPSLVDSVKHDVETVPQKLNDAIGIYTKSMINIEEKHVDIDTKQLSVEQDPIDPLENCQTSPFTGPNPVKQIMSVTTEDLRKIADSVLSLGQVDDALVYENADMMSLEGNAGSEVEGIPMKEQSMSEDLSSPEKKTETLLLSEADNEYHNNEILAKVSSATLVDGAGIRSSPKERTICDYRFDDCHSNISSTPRSSELAFSFVSCGNKVSETTLTLISSSSSLSTESYHLSEFSQAIPQETKKKWYNHTDGVTCVSDLSGALSSSESFPDMACDNNVDKRLAFSNSVLSLESTDVDSSRIDDAVSVAGSSANKHELHCKCSLLEDFMSSLEIGHVDDSSIDIEDPSMETVDLSDKVKLDESCVIVDSKLLFAVSCRARKHRSYKKIIQDAFASRKRLTKEYEQLAILYGDIDTESVQHPKQNILPSITDMSLETKHSPKKDLCDSEWELL